MDIFLYLVVLIICNISLFLALLFVCVHIDHDFFIFYSFLQQRKYIISNNNNKNYNNYNNNNKGIK